MVILAAVAAAIGWGTSDYFGGHLSRRNTPVFTIVALTELGGAVLLTPVLIARGVAFPASPRLLLAAGAGVSITVELNLIYKALSRGNAFATAPVGSLGAAAAVAVGIVSGDEMTFVIGVGLACALAGSALSNWSSPGAGSGSTRDAITLLAAALGVGTSLTLLHAAGSLDPVWVTTVAHLSTAVSAGLVAGVTAASRGGGTRPVNGAGMGAAEEAGATERRLPIDRRQLPTLALVAIAGTGGDLAYVAASHHGGELSIVSAIASLYPIMTIALGLMLVGSRAGRIQTIGVAIALLGALLLGVAAQPGG